MAKVAHLLTLVDVDDGALDARHLSVSARHEAVLTDGRRLVLLDDRGWGGSGPPDIWARTSAEGIEETTRVVVGPDEPYGERTWEEMEADHWAHLAQPLRQHGVTVDARELQQLPHDVVLSERLLARVGSGRGDNPERAD